MAATANISSSFVIQVFPTDNNATVITNPGRAFRIIAVAMNNTSGGAVDVDVTTPLGAVTPAGAWGVALAYSFCAFNSSNSEVATTQNITVQTAAFGDTPQIDIYCVASGGGQTLTAT